MMQTHLPKTIYVRRDDDNGARYLIADEHLDDMESGTVGIYELQDTVKVRRQTQFKRGRSDWKPA